jgi:general secretion pathway protein D
MMKRYTAPMRLAAIAAALMLILPPAQAQESTSLSGEKVTLNFVNADLEATVRAVGSYVNKSFLIDPRVKGTINLSSDKPLTRSQVLTALYASLRLQGFAAVEVGGVVRIVPEADAKLQGGSASLKPSGSGDQIVTQVFRLQNESAQNLVPVLRPLIAPNNTINAYPGNNTLVITDYAENMTRLAAIIAAIDSSPTNEAEIIAINNGTALDIATAVQRLAEGTTDPAQRVTVLADPRTNSLIVRAGSAARLAQIKSLITRLDMPTVGTGNLHVVVLRNAEAVKLAQTLQGILGGSGGSGGNAGQSTAASLSNQNASLGSPNASASGAASSGASASFGQSSSGNAVTVSAPNGTSITADPANNALIIRAPEPVYREIRSIIERLDMRRAQVLIESLIVEVTAEKAAELGIQWAGLSGNSDSAYRVGAVSSSSVGGSNNNLLSLATGGGQVLPGAGLNLGIFRQVGGQISLGALARALESDSNTNILSVPNIVTLDNEEARFIVGQNVPFITGQYSSGSSTTGGAAVNPFQTIERKDVGLSLRVKPQVSEGGTVRLAIYQEVSSVKDSTTSGIITDKRALETNVLVDDGSIIVLGGLMQDSVTDSVDKVPGLGNLPLVGGLFRYDKRKRSKTNLMVFLRPTVIRDANASNSLVADRYDAIRALQQQAVPDNSRIMPNFPPPTLPERPTVNPNEKQAPAAATPAPTDKK